MPEVVTAKHDRPTSSCIALQLDTKGDEALSQIELVTKISPRQASEEFGDEFTFHPRVSTASSRIVENLGMDFLARQQRHVDKQNKLYEEKQNTLYGQTAKRPKIAGSQTKNNLLVSRPCTSDRNLLKKRSKMPRNNLRRQASVLEQMDTENTISASPPSLPPRAKTYYSSMSQSVASSGIYGATTMRKRNVSDPYANFDRLQRAKMIAEKAIKYKKIFSIHGPYPLIRRALRERGWVEKEFKLPVKMKSNNKPSGDSSDVDDDDDDDYDDDSNQKDGGVGMSPRPPFEPEDENEPNDCYGIMGRLVRNEASTFQWTTRTASIDWRFLQKDQIVNHFAKANFTTKVGLCMNLRMLSCFSDGHSDAFFPRCYRLSNEEDKLDFIDDFRLTAASSILKMVVSRHVDDDYGQDSERIDNGQMPPPGGTHIIPTDVLLLAIKVCNTYAEERDHDDIDKDDSVLHIPDVNWAQLIFHYTKLAHDGAVIVQSGSYFKQCEQALALIKERNPQFFIEGIKNTWIVKPGAKSRGRGILVMNRLDEILKLVAGDSTLIKDSRWVVQKYIERPLLVYATKFDVRQWFLVSDWNPVTIWIYKESYLRFSSKPFSLKNLEPCIHLCNHSVQKHYEVDSNRHPLLPSDNMWSHNDFKDYLRGRGCHTLWDDRIFPGMKKSIVHICQTAQDTVEYRKGSFELYGADFMIDENYNPWLIEVNSSPTMSRSTSVTSKLCASVQEDTLKVILDRKKDRNCDVGLFELIYKQPMVDVPLYVGKALHVEGFTIKRPNNPARRSWNNQMTNSTNNSGINNLSSNKNNDSPSACNKSVNRASSIYSQTNTNRATKITVRQTNTTSHQSRAPPPQNGDKTSRNHAERSSSPVKMKMQNTMKRLTTEKYNTPSKPNAFNLPKCSPSTTSVASSTSNVALPSSTSQSNIPKVQSQPRVAGKGVTCGSLYSVKLPCGADGTLQTSTNTPAHFVSSSQAKIASTMGIMHLGSAYGSLIAAANRGCLPGKMAAYPQAVVPKTFPVSGVPGGDVMAGGNPLTHPAPPPGVAAVSPQTIGLGLPFQKYFNMNSEVTNQSSAASMQRRGAAYGVQDFRLGATHPRVSGIYEWLRRQQSDSGFTVCCYYSHDNDVDVKLTNPENEHYFDACEPPTNNQTNNLGSLFVPPANKYLPNTCGDLKSSVSNKTVTEAMRTCYNQVGRHSSPFTCKLSNKTRRYKPQTARSASNHVNCGVEHEISRCKLPRRLKPTTSKSLPSSPPTLPVLKLFSLKHRHERSLMQNKSRFLSVSCPSV